MLDLSLGETEALICKAADGAGLAPAVAAEAGRAARRAAARGDLHIIEVFADFFDARETSPPTPCPLLSALFERDGGGRGPATDPKWDVLRIAINADEGEMTAARCALPKALLARLDRFARMTYAPATEESRTKGAG